MESNNNLRELLCEFQAALRHLNELSDAITRNLVNLQQVSPQSNMSVHSRNSSQRSGGPDGQNPSFQRVTADGTLLYT